MTGGREKGGRKGGKEEPQEERDKGRAPEYCVHLPIYTCYCYFQTAASPTQFTSVGFQMWQPPCTLQILAATCCKHHAIKCNVQMIIPTCCKYHSTCILELQKDAKNIQLTDVSYKVLMLQIPGLQMIVTTYCKNHAFC